MLRLVHVCIRVLMCTAESACIINTFSAERPREPVPKPVSGRVLMGDGLRTVFEPLRNIRATEVVLTALQCYFGDSSLAPFVLFAVLYAVYMWRVDINIFAFLCSSYFFIYSQIYSIY